jgi:urease accessory protein
MGKIHPQPDGLVAYLASPTAGLFSGDRAHLEVVVKDGARLTLAVPSANRIHPSRGGELAELTQRVTVGESSFLEYVPEALIPFAGSRYRQSTEIHVDERGELIWLDWLMPGRLAHGEFFSFAELNLQLDLWVGPSLSLRERAVLRPTDGSMAPWMNAMTNSIALTGVIYGWSSQEVLSVAEPLHSDSVLIGAGPLAAGGVMVRALCADTLCARKTLLAIRAGLHGLRDRLPPRIGLY